MLIPAVLEINLQKSGLFCRTDPLYGLCLIHAMKNKWLASIEMTEEEVTAWHRDLMMLMDSNHVEQCVAKVELKKIFMLQNYYWQLWENTEDATTDPWQIRRFFTLRLHARKRLVLARCLALVCQSRRAQAPSPEVENAWLFHAYALYNRIRKVIGRWRQRRNDRVRPLVPVEEDQDLSMTPMSHIPCKQHVVLSFVDGTRRRYSFYDLLRIFEDSLASMPRDYFEDWSLIEECFYLSCGVNRKTPLDPYTNRPFSLYHAYVLHWVLVQRIRRDSVGKLLRGFAQRDFDLDWFRHMHQDDVTRYLFRANMDAFLTTSATTGRVSYRDSLYWASLAMRMVHEYNRSLIERQLQYMLNGKYKAQWEKNREMRFDVFSSYAEMRLRRPSGVLFSTATRNTPYLVFTMRSLADMVRDHVFVTIHENFPKTRLVKAMMPLMKQYKDVQIQFADRLEKSELAGHQFECIMPALRELFLYNPRFGQQVVVRSDDGSSANVDDVIHETSLFESHLPGLSEMSLGRMGGVGYATYQRLWRQMFALRFQPRVQSLMPSFSVSLRPIEDILQQHLLRASESESASESANSRSREERGAPYKRPRSPDTSPWEHDRQPDYNESDFEDFQPLFLPHSPPHFPTLGSVASEEKTGENEEMHTEKEMRLLDEEQEQEQEPIQLAALERRLGRFFQSYWDRDSILSDDDLIVPTRLVESYNNIECLMVLFVLQFLGVLQKLNCDSSYWVCTEQSCQLIAQVGDDPRSVFAVELPRKIYRDLFRFHLIHDDDATFCDDEDMNQSGDEDENEDENEDSHSSADENLQEDPDQDDDMVEDNDEDNSDVLFVLE